MGPLYLGPVLDPQPSAALCEMTGACAEILVDVVDLPAGTYQVSCRLSGGGQAPVATEVELAEGAEVLATGCYTIAAYTPAVVVDIVGESGEWQVGPQYTVVTPES
ncbi:hypothetical protein GCM10027055_28840 [Janibacter alkaliphilus]